MEKRKLDVIKVKRIDLDTITCELITIRDDLKDFYNEIKCEHVDIISRRFGGVLFDIICDDEALLKDNPGLPTSWWQKDGYTPNHEGLFGTLLLCHSDQEGNLLDATLNDLQAVNKSLGYVKTYKDEIVTILFHDIR